MKSWRNLVLLVVAMAVPMGAAHATILNDIFNIVVYQGDGAGINSHAYLDNPLLSTSPLYTGTYSGDINFIVNVGGSNNILDFLNGAGGSLSGTTTNLNTTLSTGSFGITTVMDITWTNPSRLAGTITHDDGVSLYLNGGTVVDSRLPTSPITTPFGLTATGGNYRMIYVAANGLPEQLTVDITAEVIPEPATLSLLGLGLAGLGFARRKRRG